MNYAVKQMLDRYDNQGATDQKNHIKEVVQEIVLSGLSRAGFFKHAAFYGGTALRIFYGLDRFSEDLDFSLKAPDASFDLASFLPVLETETRSYGLDFRIEVKHKTANSDIVSAFVKGNTKEHIMQFFPSEPLARSIGSQDLIKVKLEVDINPPAHAGFEQKYMLLPIPFELVSYDIPSLFAGKVHAVLCRKWKHRVKGRDFYDYIFFLSNGAKLNLKHLEARLIQSGKIPEGKTLTIEDVKSMLNERFSLADFSQAKEDVLPFISNKASVGIWKEEFFVAITKSIQADPALHI